MTQGHVERLNRCLSAVHSYLGLFRAQGQRVFVEIAGVWQLLGIPSAFEMTLRACRWIYRAADEASIEVRSGVMDNPQCLTLSLEVRAGTRTRPSDRRIMWALPTVVDGALPGAARWRLEGRTVQIVPASGSDLARRFPDRVDSATCAGGAIRHSSVSVGMSCCSSMATRVASPMFA